MVHVPLVHGRPLALLLVALGAFAAGCGGDGAVHVTIDLPASATLSPLSSQLARLTLIAERPGQPAQSSTRDVPPMPAGKPALSFGDIAVGAGVRVSLLGLTSSGRLVGFGRTNAPLDVSGSDVVDVTIRLRRPFAYVAGGAQLA